MTSTREALMKAAGDLFAAKGLENTTIREIVLKAKQANSSALHYHFGSKKGLVLALLADGARPIDKDRGRRLERLEAEGRASDIAALCGALVGPLIDAAAGNAEIQRHFSLLSQVLSSPDFELNDLSHVNELENATRIVVALSQAIADLPAPVVRLRIMAVLGLMAGLPRHLLAVESDGPTLTADELTRQFQAIFKGILTAPSPSSCAPARRTRRSE